MDEKKDKKDKKPSGKTGEEIFIIIVVLFLLVMFLAQVPSYFKTSSTSGGVSTSILEKITGGPNGWYENTLHFIGVAVAVYVKAATVFSIIVFLAILYVAWLTYRLSVEDAKKDREAVAPKEIPSEQSQKWQRVLVHANSQNAAEWRLSILEADVMLDDLLHSLGYSAASLGENLKSINKADFKTIDAAWEAHKVRNMIAHEGTDYPLTQHEAKRVIGLYGQVFAEFSYV